MFIIVVERNWYILFLSDDVVGVGLDILYFVVESYCVFVFVMSGFIVIEICV